MRLDIGERVGAACILVIALGAGGGQHAHLAIGGIGLAVRGPDVVIGHGHHMLAGRVIAAMAQPVMDHELDPGGGHDVQIRHRHQRLAFHQLVRDLPRARFHQLFVAFGVGVSQRHVAAKACARHAHPGAFVIGAGTIGHAEPFGTRALDKACGQVFGHLVGQIRWRGFGVDQIVPAQVHPQANDRGKRQDER